MALVQLGRRAAPVQSALGHENLQGIVCWSHHTFPRREGGSHQHYHLIVVILFAMCQYFDRKTVFIDPPHRWCVNVPALRRCHHRTLWGIFIEAGGQSCFKVNSTIQVRLDYLKALSEASQKHKWRTQLFIMLNYWISPCYSISPNTYLFGKQQNAILIIEFDLYSIYISISQGWRIEEGEV